MFQAPPAISVAALLLLLAEVAPPAGACGYHGMLDGGFGALHPRSLPVAFAIRDAVEAGIVDTSAIVPILAGSAGYWRAVGHLNDLHQRVSATDLPAGAAISVLFIDSNLWARLTPETRGYRLEVHTSGARGDDVVLITSETILAAVLDGRLPARVALERGTIEFDGNKASAAGVRRLIATALERTPAAAAFITAKPMQLFGSVPSRPFPTE